MQKNKYVDWDVKTVTAGDYTCEFFITKEMYREFEEKYYDEASPLPKISQFRIYCKDELENRLTAMPPLGLDGPESMTEPIRIALITFAFDNARVINWLRERGEHIKVENWDGLEEVNNKIRDALTTDSSLLDQLKRPVSAFVTFESEEGHARAQLYDEVVETNPNYSHYGKFLG